MAEVKHKAVTVEVDHTYTVEFSEEEMEYIIMALGAIANRTTGKAKNLYHDLLRPFELSSGYWPRERSDMLNKYIEVHKVKNEDGAVISTQYFSKK